MRWPIQKVIRKCQRKLIVVIASERALRPYLLCLTPTKWEVLESKRKSFCKLQYESELFSINYSSSI